MCASPTKLAVKAKHVNKDANFSPQRRRDLFRVRAESQPDPRPDSAEHDRFEVGGCRAGGGRRGGHEVGAGGRQGGGGEEQALEGEAAATSRKSHFRAWTDSGKFLLPLLGPQISEICQITVR